jgi:hypothetical protein
LPKEIDADRVQLQLLLTQRRVSRASTTPVSWAVPARLSDEMRLPARKIGSWAFGVQLKIGGSGVCLRIPL